MNDLSHDKQDKNFEQALQQLFNAQLRGQPYNVEELVKQHPEHEDEIRNRIRKLHKINNLFDSIAQADEKDFCSKATEDLTGRRIGNFEVVEMIGRGGMGVVYLARDTKLKRSVAVKSIPSEFQADQTAVTRFRREAELLASLNHPNIAVIHEIIEEEKTGHLILEYVQGETLAERIARQPLTLEEVLSIGLQITEAISAAHEKGVIHRDLKPSNIKITPEGRVKVLDFGLAKAHIPEEMADKTTVTHPGRVMGTPAYMSPEQARGKETDHRTDIWSFGCILFQMLTGHLPFEGETVTDTLVKIVGCIPDWDLLPSEISVSIRLLLRRCLEKDSRKRLEDISEAVTEIRQALSKPVAPRPLLRGLTARKIAVVLGGLVVVTLSTIVAYIALHPGPVPFIDLSPESLELTDGIYRNRGDDYSSRGYHNIDDLLNAIRMYENATNLNYGSALAWAKLSQAYAAMYWFHGYNEEYLDKAEKAAAKALQLDKDLPEAHWAMGYCLYWGHYDFANALKEFEKANKAQPDNSQFIAAIAYVHRQMGDFQQALYYLDKAFTLDKASERDSRSYILATEIALTHLNLREYGEALEYCDLAINLAPDQPKAYEWKACVYLREKGDTHEARKVLNDALLEIKSKDNAGDISYWLTVIDVYEGHFQDALEKLNKLASEPNDIKNMGLYNVLLYAQICKYKEDEEKATRYFTYAMNELKPLVNEKPESAYLHSKLGIAYAGLGMTEEAIKEGQRAVELRPEEADLRRRMFQMEDLARIYVMVDKYNDAIEKIKILLDKPGRLSPAILQLDPAWKKLYSYARFQKLLESDS